MLLFFIDRKPCLNNRFSLLYFLTLKLLQLFLYVNRTEKNIYFLKIPRRKFRVPFYLLMLNFRVVEFCLGWKVYFSPQKTTTKIGDRKNKGNLWKRIKRHKTNYFTTESFLSPLRDVPGITERCSANLKRLSEQSFG